MDSIMTIDQLCRNLADTLDSFHDAVEYNRKEDILVFGKEALILEVEWMNRIGVTLPHIMKMDVILSEMKKVI